MPPLTNNSKIKVYLFLAALGLHCCTQTFSGCGERGLLSIFCVQTSITASLVDH